MSATANSSPATMSARCSRLVSKSPRSQPAITSIAPLTRANAARSVSSWPAATAPSGSLIIADMAVEIARVLSRRACCRTSEVWERRSSWPRRGSAVRNSRAASAVAWTCERMSGAALLLAAFTASIPRR